MFITLLGVVRQRKRKTLTENAFKWVAQDTTFPIHLAHSYLILFVQMSTFHQGGCSISSLSPMAPALQANSIFLTEGICLLWSRTLWRTTFKMSSFTRVQTYSSSWCSQVRAESQLYWLILVSREGVDLWGTTLAGYTKSPAMYLMKDTKHIYVSVSYSAKWV